MTARKRSALKPKRVTPAGVTVMRAKPKVKNRRQAQRLYDGAYSRAELARGDTHRRRRAREQSVLGNFIGGKTARAERARKVAQARKQPRDVLGRFRAIVRKEENRVFAEAMGHGPKRYPKPPVVTKSTLRGQIKRDTP